MENTKTNPELSEKNPQLTKEQLAERREEITAFYKDNIPHLEVQADYEMLLSAIEKARAERMQAQMYMAQQYAAQKEGGQPSTPEADEFKAAMDNAMNPS